MKTPLQAAAVVAVISLAAVISGATPARAADARDPARAEAAERFDRAMALLEQGDNPAALAELQRVHAIAPHPRVLYNLGLVYAALNRPVEATRALDEVLASPGALPETNLARARRTRDDQARLVARIDLTTNVPAAVSIDGIEVGKTPLASPLAVAAGTHVVAAVGSGYLPARREITIAGERTETLQLELVPSERRLAHLAIRAPVPAADVLIDGQRVGRTPLPGSLAIEPGARVVELRRAGYRPARREISLDDGATGEVSLDLVEDDADAAAHGRLALAVSEPEPELTVDGQPRGAYRGPLSLPAGTHQLRIARAGFLPVEREVSVPAGAETTARITLVPTAETHAAYKQRAEGRRRWGRVGTIGGAALAVGALAVVAVNHGALVDARQNVDRIRDNPPCLNAMAHATEEACSALLRPADDSANNRQTIQNFGLVAIGVGVVAAGVGAALLLTADDPNRYDRPPRERGLDGIALSSWLGPGRAGLGVGGRF